VDPLAHTLVGASLAKTRLGRAAPLAVPALLLGANAPDIDAVTMLLGIDASLGYRRGFTHGALALLVLPVLLSVGLWAVGRLRGSWRTEDPAARYHCLLGVCALGVWSHPLLDWLNTYGVRLLMPWDGRWFYGDALFIVDPWLWLLAATPWVLAGSRQPRSTLLWSVVGTLTSLLVLGTSVAPPLARVVWCVGLSSLIALRLWGGLRDRGNGVALVCLALIAAYLGAMILGERRGSAVAREWLGRRGHVVQALMAGPAPANPFRREVIAETATGYLFLEVSLIGEPRIRERAPKLSKGVRDEVVEAALRAPQVQGLRTWMRFPAYRVERLDDGYRVEILDARHVGRGGIGLARVELDAALKPRAPRPE